MEKKIDVRRFITYGVIKGFLYRVHKYAFAPGAVKGRRGEGKKGKRGREKLSEKERLRGKDDGGHGDGEDGEEQRDDAELRKYLDGTHCFDEICTDLMCSEKELTAMLKRMGDVQIISR